MRLAWAFSFDFNRQQTILPEIFRRPRTTDVPAVFCFYYFIRRYGVPMIVRIHRPTRVQYAWVGQSRDCYETRNPVPEEARLNECFQTPAKIEPFKKTVRKL